MGVVTTLFTRACVLLLARIQQQSLPVVSPTLAVAILGNCAWSNSVLCIGAEGCFESPSLVHKHYVEAKNMWSALEIESVVITHGVHSYRYARSNHTVHTTEGIKCVVGMLAHE